MTNVKCRHALLTWCNLVEPVWLAEWTTRNRRGVEFVGTVVALQNACLAGCCHRIGCDFCWICATNTYVKRWRRVQTVCDIVRHIFIILQLHLNARIAAVALVAAMVLCFAPFLARTPDQWAESVFNDIGVIKWRIYRVHHLTVDIWYMIWSVHRPERWWITRAHWWFAFQIGKCLAEFLQNTGRRIGGRLRSNGRSRFVASSLFRTLYRI